MDLASNFTTCAARGGDIKKILDVLEHKYPEALLIAKLVDLDTFEVTQVVFSAKIEETRGGYCERIK